MIGSSYDQWILGGDTHYRTMRLYCPNEDCVEYRHEREIRVLIEYGIIGEDLHCPMCGEELRPVD